MPLGNQPRPAHAVPLSGLTSGRRGRGGKHFVMQGHGHSMHQQRAPAGVLGVLWQVVHGHCVELACCSVDESSRSRGCLFFNLRVFVKECYARIPSLVTMCLCVGLSSLFLLLPFHFLLRLGSKPEIQELSLSKNDD